MALIGAVQVTNVRFEHHRPQYTLGLDDPRPRISWTISGEQSASFHQLGYEIEVYCILPTTQPDVVLSEGRILRGFARVEASCSQLVPWPCEESLRPRERVSVRVRAWSDDKNFTAWSDEAIYELGLTRRSNWDCQRITSAQLTDGTSSSWQEQLFRKVFEIRSQSSIARARLYIVVQGVYLAEINGCRVSDDSLAPGWTSYDKRIRYQTYDVKHLLRTSGENCIGFCLADGWFCGRLGFFGGRRGRWGPYPALMAQLEIIYAGGGSDFICSDGTWVSKPGPALKAELYDGEKYDANCATLGWSDPSLNDAGGYLEATWKPVSVLSPLSDSVSIEAGWVEPIRPIETLDPINLITTPSGKQVVDFGQNLVGHVRLKQMAGSKYDRIILRHAEVMEDGELGIRPLRMCEAADEYVCRDEAEVSWEPRFTYHGFRYCQVDGWPDKTILLDSIEAVVCHNDMEPAGSFTCSSAKLTKLYENAVWSMRGNFVSIPTDCPQRDERLGWTGDIAQFAATSLMFYDCFGFLKDWLVDVTHDQERRNGIPAYVTPDIFDDAGIWSVIVPVAIWHDVIILVPWALYEASGDVKILEKNYRHMQAWIKSIPRDEEHQRRLWQRTSFQLGDWLDPTAPPEQPMDGQTDPLLVADAYLIRSLDLMTRIAKVLHYDEDAQSYAQESATCRQEFAHEYISPNGRISSDSQTSYALTIVFDLLHTPEQVAYAGERLAMIVRRNNFRIGTGFAGTPFLPEALVRTGHIQVAYACLLCEVCPSWLYPLTMGATTMWERWDSILPNGKVNPGEMTSFNHYCFGSVASFLCGRIGGLQCVEPGWKKFSFMPKPGGDIDSAQVKQLTPYGWISAQWKLVAGSFEAELVVPAMTSAQVLLPSDIDEETFVSGAGRWYFTREYHQQQTWPVEAIAAFPKLDPPQKVG